MFCCFFVAWFWLMAPFIAKRTLMAIIFEIFIFCINR